MNQSEKEQRDAFLNALQLCINSTVGHISTSFDPSLKLYIKDPNTNDPHLNYFRKLIPGIRIEEESGKHLCYYIPDKSQVLNSHLISFLQLTRLDEKNMRSLAELDPKYQIFIDRLGLEPSNQIKTLKQGAQTIFAAVEKQGLTLRQLAEMTGLTQATINNFKIGKDVRLSSFLNILKALNLKIKIESRSTS